MSEDGTVRRVLDGLMPLAGVIALVLVVGAVGSSGSLSFQSTVVTTLISIVLVVSLYVFTGSSGVLSFGHVAFMAIGAYACALTRIPSGLKDVTLPNLPGFIASTSFGPVTAVIVGGLVAALFALVISPSLMRLDGISAAIGTLSVLVIVNVVIANWDNVTNGAQTMVGVPITLTIWDAVPWVVAVCVIAFAYQSSSFGARLKASREDAPAARSIGIGIARQRTIAFVLSAFCAGVGGAMYAQFLGAFGPGQFYLDLTFLTIAMLVVGGTRSLAGAVIGAVFVSAASEILRRLQDDGIDVAGLHLEVRDGLREVLLAALLLAVLLFRPSGLTGGRELRLPRVRRRAAAGADPRRAERTAEA